MQSNCNKNILQSKSKIIKSNLSTGNSNVKKSCLKFVHSNSDHVFVIKTNSIKSNSIKSNKVKSSNKIYFQIIRLNISTWKRFLINLQYGF